ncbi:ThiF family adenylyltransferase [Crateriforma conspicua]|uniref:ThiF family adenylyltransferase n=1 Tax=Crateriforma conspicua TaxID=2527996 RepID=UPI001187D4DD|nr:ThiF family adenylyltransferase [Crateriforma conspicua]QDV60899.1 Molybdopterin-synthase adenylyltransferase [Crateriforma conspicua]
MNSPRDRYARQIQLSTIGDQGQRRIGDSTAAVVGCGALGTVAAELLARAGVGRLRLVDRDIVEWSNLQRQSLFDENDARSGSPKAAAAADRLRRINSDIQIEPQVVDVLPGNITGVLDGVDLVIDACDNFELRLLINDWSLENEIPFIHGGCVGSGGQVRLFDGTGQPCFRCLVRDLPPPGSVQTCDTAGVLGAATHLIASLQAAEAIKWLAGSRSSIRTSVLSIDLWQNKIRQIDTSEIVDPQCPACVGKRRDFLNADAGPPAAALCGRESVQVPARQGTQLDLSSFEARWQDLGRVQCTPFFVRLHLDESQSLTLFRDGRAVISGTRDVAIARSLYDRYVG